MSTLTNNVNENTSASNANLTTAVSNGLLLGLIEVFWWVSMLSLMFSGRLADYFGRAAVFLVLGALITVVIMTYYSSWRGTIAHPQEVPAAILVLAAAQIEGVGSAETTTPALFATVIAAIGIASISYGIISYVLGHFKLGSLVRFMPYPVVAGFLGGTGWLLLMGGITTALPPDARAVSTFTPDALIFWVPTIVLAAIIYVISLRISHPLLLPSLITLATLGLFSIAAAQGISLQQLTDQGWLIGALPTSDQFQLLSLTELRGIEWSAILSQAQTFGVLATVSVIGMLLNNSGFELAMGADFDNNRDLKVTGVGNIAAGLVGGWPSFLGLSWSSINAKGKKHNPLGAIISVVFAAILLWFATQLLAYLPRLVGGVTFAYMGFGFLHDWVITPAKKLPRLEYAILLLIVIVIAAVGLLEGIVTGLVLAVLLFVVSYGRVNVVRYQLSGVHQQSRVTRLPERADYLRSVGSQTQILQLHGYVFFGTANSLLDRVRATLEQADLRYVVLDFKRVSGVDSTAMLSFTKMQQLTMQREIALVMTGVSAETKTQLQQEFNLTTNPDLHLFNTLDQALQWIEEQQLQQANISTSTLPPSLDLQLQMLLPSGADVAPLLAAMDEIRLANGDYIIRQGDAPFDMFFVKDGLVTAQLERDDGTIVRLETMGVGRVVGELGFYRNQPRTAAVVATGSATVYRLSQDRLQTLEHEQPEIASTLHQLIVHLLSDRVTHLVGVVNVLQQ